MGVRDLQDYLEADCQSACKPVDLLKIARTYQAKRRGKNSGRLRLIVDAESCLDRLYGGFYSDWACGGQWNRMTHFLGILIQACQSTGMELVVFFNGAAETERLSEWAEQMVAEKKKVASVLKHIHHKATPPPKVWWIPPVCLRQCLRMVLRQMGVAVACSMDDHHQEVIAYCRENNFHGLVAQDADYAIFDPPRYFSSHNLKLTYRQALETKEYVMDEVAQQWDLNPKRFCILAALLGNHILTENDLKFFYDSVTAPGNKSQADRIKAVVGYVRALKSENDLDEISKDVFNLTRTGKSPMYDVGALMNKFKKSIQYYMNGTQDGFLNYKPKGLVSTSIKQPGSYPGKPEQAAEKTAAKSSPKTAEGQTKVTQEVKEPAKVMVNGDQKHEEREEEEDEDKDDHEEELGDLKADSVYTDQESGYANPDSVLAPAIVIDPPSSSQTSIDKDLVDDVANLVLEDLDSDKGKDAEAKVEDAKDQETKEEPKSDTSKEKESEDDQSAAKKGDTDDTGTKIEVKVPSLSSASSSTSSTPAPQISPVAESSDKVTPTQQKNKTGPSRQSAENKLPQVAPEIMRIASERHQKGLMAPWIYQVLSQGEIKIGVTMEDESNRELPTAVELFRPIRQAIYAILFDMSKRRPTGKPNSNGANKEVVIKEWTLPRGSSVPRVDLVRARPLEWKVPTVRRLWLGQAIEDKNRRLRALLTCLRSDTPRMLNTSYVPQHLLIMACVLRYMVLNKDVRVLRKHELDAFLCTSVSPLLHDVETMQEMKLPMITSRGVQLAALFMRGVEAAIFANDACGAPIPWSMCCPWHFFDGKLFHFKLLKANNNTALLDICDGHMEQMVRVERLRNAILDGIPPDALFARPSLPMMQQPQYGGGHFFHPSNNLAFRPAGAPPNMMGPMCGSGPMERGRGRGLLGRSPVDSRGGQLQIAGVVVGNWGANVQANQSRPGLRGGGVAPPHVTAVGPRRGGAGGGAMRGRGNSGRGLMRGTGMPQRPGSAGRGYSTKGQNGTARSNITAVKSGVRGGAGGVRGGATGARGKGARVRGPAGYNPAKVIVEQRSRGASAGALGRGRGMTVENPVDSSSVVSVSQLMKSGPRVEKGQGDDRDFGQFMDAEPVKHAEVKVNLDQDDELGVSGEDIAL